MAVATRSEPAPNLTGLRLFRLVVNPRFNDSGTAIKFSERPVANKLGQHLRWPATPVKRTSCRRNNQIRVPPHLAQITTRKRRWSNRRRHRKPFSQSWRAVRRFPEPLGLAIRNSPQPPKRSSNPSPQVHLPLSDNNRSPPDARRQHRSPDKTLSSNPQADQAHSRRPQPRPASGSTSRNSSAITSCWRNSDAAAWGSSIEPGNAA